MKVFAVSDPHLSFTAEKPMSIFGAVWENHWEAIAADWLEKAATQLDSLAPRQLISTGSEGKAGCEEDISLFERIHQNEHIDYLTIHIWPYNWGWVSEDSLQQKLDNAKQKTEKYITEHLSVAERCGKPMVIEEFGYPRDGFQFGTPRQLL